MARRNERVDAYSSSHYVVHHAIDERVLCFGFRKLHMRISNSSQRDVQEQPVIKKVRSTAVECCHHMSVSVRSSGQFLYSRSSGKIPDFDLSLYNSHLSVTQFLFDAQENFSSPFSSA